MNQKDEYYMSKAIEAARWAENLDEVPVGCVIVQNDKIISWGWNSRQTEQDPTGHAEIMAIRKAAEKLNSWRLEDCTLYVTLEPCCMCAGAIIQSRIPRVVFGASDPKGGCCGSCTDVFQIKGFNHYPEAEGGILSSQCSEMLSSYFRKKRKQKKNKKSQSRSQA